MINEKLIEDIVFARYDVESMVGHLRRVSSSISASVAEGCSARDDVDSVFSVRMARTSQAEMNYQVQITKGFMEEHTDWM